jgi:transposase-like protein
VAVRWYLRYALSYRDVEELLAERGVKVDHVTVFRWVQRFTPLLIDAARPCRHAPGDRWFVDETYAKIAGRWVYLYRAIDQFGQVIDVLVAEKRDLAATRRFFTRALQVIPVGAEPVKGLFWGADLSFRFLRQVLGAPSYGVGVRDRPKADRGAAGGP